MIAETAMQNIFAAVEAMLQAKSTWSVQAEFDYVTWIKQACMYVCAYAMYMHAVCLNVYVCLCAWLT